MNVIQTQTNISFGLNYNTHRKIAQRVIENEYPQLRKYAPVIKSAVQKPDFDEKGFNFNTHFYYPDENIFRPRQSFFDFDGVHNARVKFNEHIDNFFTASKYFRYTEMADEAGRAKHFLDDMSVGFHVHRGNILQKWKEAGIHKRFEDYIYNNEDVFIKNAQRAPVEFKTKEFDDIFMSVVNYAKNIELPDDKHFSKWEELAQNTVNVAMDASRVFLNKISEFLP